MFLLQSVVKLNVNILCRYSELIRKKISSFFAATVNGCCDSSSTNFRLLTVLLRHEFHNNNFPESEDEIDGIIGALTSIYSRIL